jgi:hypothetical protein
MDYVLAWVVLHNAGIAWRKQVLLQVRSSPSSAPRARETLKKIPPHRKLGLQATATNTDHKLAMPVHTLLKVKRILPHWRGLSTPRALKVKNTHKMPKRKLTMWNAQILQIK